MSSRYSYRRSANPSSPLLSKAMAVVMLVVVGAILWVAMPFITDIYNSVTEGDTQWVVPQVAPQYQPPEHVGDRSNGNESQKRLASWATIANAYAGGKPPSWCGQRDDDGSLIFTYVDLVIQNTAGKVYKNLGLIFNTRLPDRSTAMYNMKLEADGKPRGGEKSDFHQVPCPPKPPFTFAH